MLLAYNWLDVCIPFFAHPTTAGGARGNIERIGPKAWYNPVQWKGEGKWRSSSQETLLSWVPLHSSSLFAHQRRARHGLTVSIHASGTPIPTVVVSYTTPSRPLSTSVGFILCDATALAHTRRVQPASGPPHWRRLPKRRSTSPAPRPRGISRQPRPCHRRPQVSRGEAMVGPEDKVP